MSKKIMVLLVDDHSIARKGVALYLNLQDDIEVVGEAESGDEAVRLVAKLLPDVVLMDLSMPGGVDGVEATRQVRNMSPHTQVIVLTSFHDDEHIFPAVRAGALSYILKTISAEQLVETVRMAARGEAVLNPQVATRVVKELHGERQEEVNPYTLLSDRELEVLQLVANGMTNTEVAEELVVAIKTVRTHVSNILRKLHLKDRTQAAVYAWRKGIVRK